ncbi:MAG: ATP-dependent zinc metalloprotease FtsH [Spirochaetales bacterium]
MPIKKNNNIFNNIIKIVLAVALILLVISSLNLTPNYTELSWTEFRDKVVAEQITNIDVVGSTIKARDVNSQYLVDDFPEKYDYVATYIDAEYLMNFIDAYNAGELAEQELTGVPTVQVIATYSFEQASIIDSLLPYLSIALFVAIAIIVIRMITSTNSKSMGFSRSRAKLAEMPKVRFKDVAGAKEEKEELQEIVEFLKNPSKFTNLGARIPKGVLLVGPPGTGKTLLARAIAGESGVPFFSISGSDFVEMFVGVGASRVRDLFEQAKKSMPCIVFIDEIDAVGRQRGAGLGGGNDEREQTLNQLLVQMDGFEANEGVIIIAATNRPDVLDPALLRPGRFDRQIVINIPDVAGREKILEVHARNKPLSSDVDFKNLARMTSGFSGADLENLLNEAAILAARANRVAINMNDISEGINKVIMGPQKKSRIVTERDKKITAYHEAGHAIVQRTLEHCDEVHEVSIIPRGMAGGYTMTRPSTDDAYYTFNKLNDNIAAYMGGRIAEELIIKDISTGASNDIEQATKLAHKMVTQFGMSKLGFVNLDSGTEVFIGRDYSKQQSYSEATAGKIDEEIKEILDRNYLRAKEAIEKSMDKLEVLAQLLLEKETIYKEELDQVMNGESVENIIKAIDRRISRKKKAEEKEVKAAQELKAQRIEEIKQKTIDALKKEGLIVTNVKAEIMDYKELKEKLDPKADDK